MVRRRSFVLLPLLAAACSSPARPGAGHTAELATAAPATQVVSALAPATAAPTALATAAPTPMASGAAPVTPTAAPDVAPTPEPDAGVAYRPITEDALGTDYCRAPVLASVRQTLKKHRFPECAEGVVQRYARATINGKVLVIVGVRDLRPTWGDAPATELVGTFVNDKLVEGAAPWTALGKLQGLGVPQTQALLQGAALVSGAHEQIITMAQAEGRFSDTSGALAEVKANPPGIGQAGSGTWLRVYHPHASGGRGGACSYLDRYVLQLDTAGKLAVYKKQVRVEGTVDGGPCR